MKSIDEIARDLAVDIIRARVVRDMPRDELRHKIVTRYLDVEVNSTPQEQQRAEEIVKRHREERTGIKDSDYPYYLTQHPNQRIYIGDRIE